MAPGKFAGNLYGEVGSSADWVGSCNFGCPIRYSNCQRARAAEPLARMPPVLQNRANLRRRDEQASPRMGFVRTISDVRSDIQIVKGLGRQSLLQGCRLGFYETNPIYAASLPFR